MKNHPRRLVYSTRHLSDPGRPCSHTFIAATIIIAFIAFGWEQGILFFFIHFCFCFILFFSVLSISYLPVCLSSLFPGIHTLQHSIVIVSHVKPSRWENKCVGGEI